MSAIDEIDADEPEIEEAAIAPPVENAVMIHDMKAHHCRWPLWDNPFEPFKHYCGARRETAGPYCPAHTMRAKPPAGEKR